MAAAGDEPPLPSGPRRPFYYPAGWGCLFWVFVLLLGYLLIGLIWAPLWYPVWW